MRVHLWTGLVAALMLLTAVPALAAKRVALVVGNDAYVALPKLQKAVNDARAVGAALRELGFEVIAGENLSRRDMSRSLGDLEKRIAPGDTVLFYFAGHGVALGADNVLLPADMPAPQSGDEGLVRDEGFAVDGLIKRLQKHGAAATLLVLDACRNNPFEAGGARDIGLSRGLAKVDTPKGVFVLFSAGTGQTALDRLPGADADPNSVFTRKLVPLLRRPGLSHVTLAKAVQAQVDALARSANHDQQPAYYDQIIGEFVLNGSATAEPASGPAVAAVEPTKSEPGKPSGSLWSDLFGGAQAPEDARAWATIEATTSCGVLASFLARFPDGVYADFAKARQRELNCGKVAVVVPDKPATAACSGTFAKVGTEERCLVPGDVFRDCRDCPEMVVVPAGTFTMGSPESEEGRSSNEGPQHEVTIVKSFAVGKFEVTRGQFAAFVKATGYQAGGSCWTWNGTEWKDTAGKSWRDPGFAQSDDHPVACVSWDGAKAYVGWLARETGQAYRLLSEAEWEYAARGQTKPGGYPRFHFGDGESDLCQYANAADRSAPFDDRNQGCDDGVGAATAPAGRYDPNAFGLHDMLGNVWEWAEDCYADSYAGAASDGTASTSGDCSRRVLRGGSWYNLPQFLRAAFRSKNSADYRNYFIGFRLGRTLSP